MTQQEFFRKARRRGPWSVNHYGKVRNGVDHCPLVSVGQGLGWNPAYIAKRLRLRESTAWRIAMAADGRRTCKDRTWLLAHLGVS